MHTPQSHLAGDSKLTLKGQFQKLKEAWPLSAICFAFLFATLTTISHGTSFHPDERHMVMVTLDLEKNGMNPLSFAYGSLPFYLTWGLAKFLALLWPTAFGYDNLFLIGRGLSAFVGMLGLIATWKLALSICNSRSVAVIATALLATNTFYFQLSRFFAVDIFLTTASLWTIWAILQIRSGKLWAFVLSGWLWGFALATKVSALNLALPLGLAILIFGWQARMLKSARWWIYASSIPLVGMCSFLLAEPFALLDKDLFIKHTMEQISMVRGDWRPPYIIQYAHTAPWLYPLHQIYFYTLGPVIALASGIGLLYSLRAHFSASLLIVSAWALVTFYIYGGFPVKFPRYLLPLYPMFALWAALFSTAFLKSSITKNIGKLLPILVVSISVVRWLGFYQIYSEPHAYETASRWIYQNIAPGSKLLGVDWDDRLPLSLPGLDARQYLFEGANHELQLYHPDNSEKVTQYATKLANADYLIFPTARSYGAIPRIPEEYPLSTQMFQLLFRGALGYELVYSQKTRPTFAGYVWNNDEADESLTVYDHPKVLVFKNLERLGAEEISRRLSEPYSFAPLPTLSDMLKRDGPAYAQAAQPLQSTPLAISLWALVLLALGVLGSTFTKILFTQKQDSKAGCNKALGLTLLSGTLWIGTSLNFWRSTGAHAWLLFTFLTLLGLSLGYLTNKNSNIISSLTLKSSIKLDTLFWISFACFLLLRSFQPEIFWGEKPMDFGFLNYFIRLETLPPQDPWAAGSSMRYYYFGSYMMALLHKMSGVDSAVGYNLSMATVAALSISVLYSLLAYLTKKPRIALCFAILVLAGSNIEVLLLALQGEKKSFDLFWASSRLFTEPSITEYPFWAFLFADLHAHVIVVPVILTSLLFLAHFFRSESTELSSSLILHRLLCGMLLGLIFITNTWDAISFGMLTGLILVYTSFMHGRGRYPQRAIARMGSALADFLRDSSLLAIGALPFLVIFKLNSANDLTPHFGYNHTFELNNLSQILRHLGHWLVIPCGVFLQLLLSSRSDVSRWKRFRNILYVLILMSPPLLLSAGSPHQPQTLSWDVIAVSCFLCALGAALALNSRSSRGQRFGALSLWLAGCIMAFAELCFLMDHMNTVFKFYNAIWLLLGIANATLFLSLLQNRGAKYRLLSRYLSFFVYLVSGICFFTVMVGSVYNAYIMTSFRRINGPRPTLNGTAYLKENAFHEYQAIQWLRLNVQGTPVILEAHGQSYQNFTRFSMHTGLPTVLGWEYHVQQRGTSRQAVQERIQAINAIYSSDNIEIAETYLKLLAVRYIIIGVEEQKLYANGTYSSVGLRKFAENPKLFKLRMQSGSVRIYEFGT